MKKTLFALALLGASATASADSWIYGGVNVGQSDFMGDETTSYGVHAGTGILPLIGLEVGYQNHGEFKRHGVTFDADSVYFAVKPSIDFGPLHVYAKGGLHKWDVSSNVAGLSDDDVDLMYGVGAEYFLFGPVSVGASYNIFEMDKEEVKTLSLNATFHFL